LGEQLGRAEQRAETPREDVNLERTCSDLAQEDRLRAGELEDDATFTGEELVVEAAHVDVVDLPRGNRKGDLDPDHGVAAGQPDAFLAGGERAHVVMTHAMPAPNNSRSETRPHVFTVVTGRSGAIGGAAEPDAEFPQLLPWSRGVARSPIPTP